MVCVHACDRMKEQKTEKGEKNGKGREKWEQFFKSVLLLAGLFKHGLSISKAYLVDITAPYDRPYVLGYFNAISNCGFIIGPLLAGYLAEIDSTLQLTLMIGTAVFATNFFIVLFLLPPLKQQSIGSGSGLKMLCSNLHIFKGFHWRDMKGIITVHFLSVMAMMIFRNNFVVFMEDKFSLSHSELGKVLSYNAIAAALTSALCGRISKQYPRFSRHAVRGYMLQFVSLLLIALASSVTQVTVYLFSLSLATSYLRISMVSMMLESGRADEKGAILGFTYSMTSISRMLAPGVVGVVQEIGTSACSYVMIAFALQALLAANLFL